MKDIKRKQLQYIPARGSFIVETEIPENHSPNEHNFIITASLRNLFPLFLILSLYLSIYLPKYLPLSTCTVFIVFLTFFSNRVPINPLSSILDIFSFSLSTTNHNIHTLHKHRHNVPFQSQLLFIYLYY